MLALGIGACKKSGGSSDQIELTVLNYFSLANPGAAEENVRVWDAFAKAHPEIKIVREDDFNEPFHHKTESYAAAGRIPDVVQCWPSGRSTTLHTQHLLKDLAPLVQRDNFAAVFTPVSLDPSQQGAGYLAMITRGLTATNAFFINMEVLRDCGLQPAKTYSELKAQVPVLRAKGYETLLMACEDTWVMQSCLFSAVAGRFCGEGWDQKIISGQAKFTDPDFVAALNFIKTLYDDGVLLRSTLSIDYGSGAGLFATNKAAYLVDGDWRVGDFLTDPSTGQALISPDRQKDILITVFPDIDLPGVKFNKSNTVVLATGWGMSAAIPAGSAKEEAAWTLLKWLTGKETQSFFVENGTFATPSRTDIDLASLPLEPMQVTVANLGKEYNVSTVVIDAAFEGPVYTPLNDGLQAIGMGTQTPQQVAAATQAAFDAWKATQ
jgi:raffinose/stachyose/melibiose transport system substrate-binding protein